MTFDFWYSLMASILLLISVLSEPGNFEVHLCSFMFLHASRLAQGTSTIYPPQTVHFHKKPVIMRRALSPVQMLGFTLQRLKMKEEGHQHINV